MTASAAPPVERIVIIGGGSGMGLALAESLLADSADVTIVGRSPDRLAAAAQRVATARRLHT